MTKLIFAFRNFANMLKNAISINIPSDTENSIAFEILHCSVLHKVYRISIQADLVRPSVSMKNLINATSRDIRVRTHRHKGYVY